MKHRELSKPETWKPTFLTSTDFQGKCKTLHPSHLRHAWGLGLTWGTHLGDTKLVASITGSPASESMSISLIFIGVGIIFCNAEKNQKRQVGKVSNKMVSECSLLVQSFYYSKHFTISTFKHYHEFTSNPGQQVQNKACLRILQIAFCSGSSFSLENELILIWRQYFPVIQACKLNFCCFMTPS